MISRILLSGAPSFAASNCDLEDLARFNFVFGPNGTGKTTISRVLGESIVFDRTGYEVSPESSSPEVHVFNRDYIAQTLQEADRLAGVFILDDENPEARSDYGELTKEGGTIDEKAAEVKIHSDDLGAIERQIENARQKLKDHAWQARTEIPSELQQMFAGFSGSREKFVAELISIEKITPPHLQDLLVEAKAAFDNEGTTEAKLSKLVVPSESDVLNAQSLLDQKVAGSDQVSLAEAIAHLQNHDWVAEGRQFLSSADGHCPFCQQALPSSFLLDLAEYFNDEYERKIAQIGNLSKRLLEETISIRAIITQFSEIDHSFVELAARAAAIGTLNEVLQRNTSSVAAKVKSPSASFRFEDPSAAIREVNRVIGDANEKIGEHNARLSQRGKARATLIRRCWTHFAWAVTPTELSMFHGVRSATQVRRDALSASLAKANSELAALREQATLLEKTLVSSAPAIDKINRVLQSVGFTRFQLSASSDVKDGYRLHRADGSAVEDSLSEGERTFIAFLYFYTQLEGRSSKSDGRSVVAVIDDPISSLDSDVLFVVGTLIRRLLHLVNEKTGTIEQVVVLTHNIQFYLELTYQRAKDKRTGLMKGRRFYEIQRNSEGDSVTIASDVNNIQSNYQRLWSEVKKEAASTGVAGPGLENVLRRVLENYFTVIGSYPDLDELMEEQSGDAAVACRALLAWLHHGSHALIDNFDYSPSGISKEVFLSVFKSIFERTNQLGHYEMMMSKD